MDINEREKYMQRENKTVVAIAVLLIFCISMLFAFDAGLRNTINRNINHKYEELSHPSLPVDVLGIPQPG